MTADGCGIADVNLPQHSIKWREKSGLVIVDCQVERHRSLMIEMSGYLVANSTGRSEGWYLWRSYRHISWSA